jgi:hypothetical protein
MATVTLYTAKDADVDVSVIVFDAGRKLSKGEQVLLQAELWDNLPYSNIVDAIYEPPELFSTGVAYKASCILDPRVLPAARTVFSAILATLDPPPPWLLATLAVLVFVSLLFT